MRQKIIFLMVVLTILVNSLSAQRKDHPEWSVSDISPFLLINKPDQVIRTSNRSFMVRSLDEGVLEEHKVITLLNEEGDANMFILSQDENSKIEQMEAVVYDAEGKFVRKVKDEEYKEYPAVDGYSLYQDSRVKFVEISHSNYPYTVELITRKKLKGIEFAIYPDWDIQDFKEAVQFSNFAFTLPEDFELFIDYRNIQLKPEVHSDGKNTTYQWEVKNLTSKTPVDYSPSKYEVLPMVLTAPKQFRIDQYNGSMASWNAFGQFIGQLFEGKNELPEKELQVIKALAAEGGTTEQKIIRLYNYLQENMRYVSVQLGIGGWQPYSAAYVSENRYGDCKALSNFMATILKEAGITAYPALIRNGKINELQFKEEFIDPSFNHVILYVPETDTWLECTSNNYPVNYIGSGNYNRQALLITEQGGQLKNTPKQDESNNVEIILASVKVTGEGAAEVDYQSELRGERHEYFRAIQHNFNPEEQKEWALENINLSNFQLESLTIEAEKDMPKAVFNYHGLAPRFAARGGKRLFVPINAVSNYTSVPDKLESRSLPIVFNRALREYIELTIELPDGFTMESLPESPKRFETSFADYTLEIRAEGDRQVTIKREVIFKRQELPAEAYDQFRKFFRDISRAEKLKLVLVEKKT